MIYRTSEREYDDRPEAKRLDHILRDGDLLLDDLAVLDDPPNNLISCLLFSVRGFIEIPYVRLWLSPRTS
jgi:hypothetical protein